MALMPLLWGSGFVGARHGPRASMGDAVNVTPEPTNGHCAIVQAHAPGSYATTTRDAIGRWGLRDSRLPGHGAVRPDRGRKSASWRTGVPADRTWAGGRLQLEPIRCGQRGPST